MSITFQEQMKMFEGYAFDMATCKIKTPEGYLLNRSQFNIRFGGMIFDIGPRATTKRAYVAFTRNEYFRPAMINCGP